jgi:DNA-binding LacI/PurR family transcriptional regulator
LLDNVLGETAFSSIVMDDYGAGVAAAEHLISRGHVRVAVCWSPGHAPFHVRAKGFLDEAVRQLGVEGDGRRKWRLESCRESQTDDWGKAIESFLSMQPRPTAIFCVNDLLALSVRDVAQSSGIRIPQELSLIGFDDSPIARVPEIGLTSFVYPSGLIGKKAANLLIDSIEAGPPASRNSVVMEPVLTERTTVASPQG